MQRYRRRVEEGVTSKLSAAKWHRQKAPPALDACGDKFCTKTCEKESERVEEADIAMMIPV